MLIFLEAKARVKRKMKKRCGKSEVQLTSRIIGGTIADIGEFPWMARLIYYKNNVEISGCSGTLIHRKYVLTAAHCVSYKNKTGTL